MASAMTTAFRRRRRQPGRARPRRSLAGHRFDSPRRWMGAVASVHEDRAGKLVSARPFRRAIQFERDRLAAAGGQAAYDTTGPRIFQATVQPGDCSAGPATRVRPTSTWATLCGLETRLPTPARSLRAPTGNPFRRQPEPRFQALRGVGLLPAQLAISVVHRVVAQVPRGRVGDTSISSGRRVLESRRAGQ